MTIKFITIGENIHCTRILLLRGKKVKREGEREFIPFEFDGRPLELEIPDWYRETQSYRDGKVKHCIVALREAMSAPDETARETGLAYLLHLARRQIDAGTDYLDVNVDEFSPDPAERSAAMEWLVPRLREHFDLPLSIDSSNLETLEKGLAAHGGAQRPMLNSVSLERPEAVDLAKRFNAAVVASAFGTSGMPADAAERIANVEAILERLFAAGIPASDVYVDPLVFPVGTDPGHGVAFLEAVRGVRERYGEEIHITGGFSNVSFGMPKRKFLNMVFTRLSIDAGADSGIIDPIQVSLDAVLALDPADEKFRLAQAALTGEDPFGMNYLEAFRDGRL